MKKPKDTVAEAIKSIQNEADHILETLKEMQKEKMPAGARSSIHILRDNAMAIKEFSLKAILKKDALKEKNTKRLSENE